MWLTPVVSPSSLHFDQSQQTENRLTTSFPRFFYFESSVFLQIVCLSYHTIVKRVTKSTLSRINCESSLFGVSQCQVVSLPVGQVL